MTHSAPAALPRIRHQDRPLKAITFQAEAWEKYGRDDVPVVAGIGHGIREGRKVFADSDHFSVQANVLRRGDRDEERAAVAPWRVTSQFALRTAAWFAAAKGLHRGSC